MNDLGPCRGEPRITSGDDARMRSVAALGATIVMGIVGLLSLAGLVVFRSRALARWVVPTAFVLALCATATMGYAANLGGQIRHTEIRAATVTAPPGEEAGRPERGER